MNIPQQFTLVIKEMLVDKESNVNIEMTMNRFPYELQTCLTEYNCNIELMLIFIDSVLVQSKDGYKMINEEQLHSRAKLMQKLIIQDDFYLLNFLSKIIDHLYTRQLSLNEIDKVINVLNFEEVIPLYIRNHWTYAKNPNGQSDEIVDRLQAIRCCLSFKYYLSCDIDPNDDCY